MSSKRSWLTAVFAVCAVVLSAAGGVRYVSYGEARPTVDALRDVLPADLQGKTGAPLEAAWSTWVAAHDRDIRARLAAGDEDTIVNWLLLGTSFTQQPRAFIDVPASRPQELSNVIGARAHDLVSALGAAGADERRLFARAFFQKKGYRLESAAERTRLEQYLLTAVVRVNAEQARFADALQTLRRLGDQSEAFAERSKLFRDRGLSLDTSIQPSFALEQSLRELQTRGLLAPGSVHDVAVIGPGLDFSDKNSGFDFYPQQTLQPFALIDSLLRVGLTEKLDAFTLTTIDLSPRVNDHLTRARQNAAAGSPYTIRIPLDRSVSWTPEFLSFWNTLGTRVGADSAAAVTGLPSGVQARLLKIAPAVVSRLNVDDLNVVVQQFANRKFDLVVATNVFVYYDVFDQALALANVGSMLRPGGFLLSNNALIELPSSRMRSVGYLTTSYSNRPDDGDHVVWYRRTAN